MMPTIRVEDDIFQGLKTIAEPFTDTPNTVIRRLLEDRGVLDKAQVNAPSLQIAQDKNKSNTKYSENGRGNTLTPQAIYEQFLLYVLGTNFKGSASKLEVTKAVIALMKSRGYIGSADIVHVATGETKAENTIAWGRNALKEQGLISRVSPRGIWELTPEGIKKAKSILLPSIKE